MSVFANKLNIAVIFFGYNRPEKLASTINSYLNCFGADIDNVFVFIDGFKDGSEELVKRSYFTSKAMLPNANVVKRETNFGLKRSIFAGVSEVLNTYDAAIIIEDDLVLSPFFYKYMVNSLNRYYLSSDVYQISGFSYEDNFNRCSFLPLTTSWGWGTWSNRWQHFDLESKNMDTLNSKSQIHKFNVDGAFNFSDMLRKEYKNEVSSWAIRWYHYVFLNNGIVLYPNKSLVNNEGFGLDGTHSSVKAKVLFKNVDFKGLNNFDEIVLPNSLSVDLERYNRLSSFFKNKRKAIFFKKIISLLGVK